ncbi:shikimate kinase [Candidatus Poribacteria bacterium]|nr:shikimate kinase [Candidatus Poribacteria bacterium]
MMNIILIGFMGTGKSSVGKLLAQKMKKNFVDLDEEITKKQNKTISEIFENYGEKYFRDLESDCLKKILKNDNCIISTGGGVVLKKENIAMLKNDKNKVILLVTDPDTIYKRIKNETHRPLLQGNNPLEKIQKLLNQRESYYQKAADIKIDTSLLSPQKIVEKIEKLLNWQIN